MNRLFALIVMVALALPAAFAAPAHYIVSADEAAVDLESSSKATGGICPNVEPQYVNGEIDSDRDYVPDGIDNCKCVKNPDQADANHNGYGDVCDNEIPEFGWLPAVILLAGCLALIGFSRRR